MVVPRHYSRANPRMAPKVDGCMAYLHQTQHRFWSLSHLGNWHSSIGRGHTMPCVKLTCQHLARCRHYDPEPSSAVEAGARASALTPMPPAPSPFSRQRDRVRPPRRDALRRRQRPPGLRVPDRRLADRGTRAGLHGGHQSLPHRARRGRGRRGGAASLLAAAKEVGIFVREGDGRR